MLAYKDIYVSIICYKCSGGLREPLMELVVKKTDFSGFILFIFYSVFEIRF